MLGCVRKHHSKGIQSFSLGRAPCVRDRTSPGADFHRVLLALFPVVDWPWRRGIRCRCGPWRRPLSPPSGTWPGAASRAAWWWWAARGRRGWCCWAGCWGWRAPRAAGARGAPARAAPTWRASPAGRPTAPASLCPGEQACTRERQRHLCEMWDRVECVVSGVGSGLWLTWRLPTVLWPSFESLGSKSCHSGRPTQVWCRAAGASTRRARRARRRGRRRAPRRAPRPTPEHRTTSASTKTFHDSLLGAYP